MQLDQEAEEAEATVVAAEGMMESVRVAVKVGLLAVQGEEETVARGTLDSLGSLRTWRI